MANKAQYRVGQVVYDGTEIATKLRTDMSYLVSLAIVSLDTPLREHRHPYIQVTTLDTNLHLHDEISPTAPLVVQQLIKDVPSLHGAGLQVKPGFGAGTLMFESTSPEALKRDLVNLRQALENKPTAFKAIHDALAPQRVHAVAMV